MLRSPAFYFATFMTLSLGTIATATSGTETIVEESEVVLGDVLMGENLYKKNCRGCHGPTAKGLASYPKLREQPLEYLVDRLERYRKGERFGPNTPLMAPRAKKLSDEDIVNISTFIVSLD